MTPSTDSSVFPTYVALVPLEQKSRVTLDQLIEVADALQIQVVRDLSPVWDVSAKVVPFAKLEDVPPGYIPLTITETPLPLHRNGFHFALNGLPFGVVEKGDVEKRDDWSLATSHELIEMLCNPFGQRMVLAPSLPDAERAAHDAGQDQKEEPSETSRGADSRDDAGPNWLGEPPVNYFLEVCDPCEHSTYRINDVLVSDFVTPHYYQVGPNSPGPYSFLGRIERPLAVLEGGYISWRKNPPGQSIYQASSEPANQHDLEAKTVGSQDLPSVPQAELKERIAGASSNFTVDAQRRRRPNARPRPKPALAPPPPAGRSPRNPGDQIRQSIETFLQWVDFHVHAPTPPVQDVIDLLNKLVNDDTEWERFNSHPAVREDKLCKLGVNVGGRSPEKFVSRQALSEVLTYLEELPAGANQFGEPVLGLWLAAQIG